MRCYPYIFTFIIFANIGYSQCIQGNCQNGTGTLVIKDEGRYTGEFKNSRFDGKGIFYYANGDKYLGHWSRSKREGKGKFITDDYTYIGGFSNDKFSGKGQKQFANGEIVSGNFSQGSIATSQQSIAQQSPRKQETRQSNPAPKYKFSKNCNSTHCHKEYGTYIYKDGSEYKGYFLDGMPNGRGMVTYSNGALYDGDWAHDSPNGEGVYVQNNGDRVRGLWQKGKLTKRFKKSSTNNKPRSQAKPTKIFDEDVKIWAVVVGIAAYNHMPSLRFTDDDAYKMYAFLKSPEGGALPDEQVKVLVDDEATKNGILAAMETLYQKADANDVVMLYFSGHGLAGSFIPYDFDGYKNKIRHDEIQAILDDSEAKHKVCYVDACYSGGLATGKGTLQESIKHFYTKFEQTKGSSAVLMSSKENEISLEFKGLRQGVFTHFLMRGLKGEADMDSNAIVTIDELYEFVTKGVRKYTAYQQTPVINGKYNRDMPVAMIRE